jgi:hypothetical protein
LCAYSGEQNRDSHTAQNKFHRVFSLGTILLVNAYEGVVFLACRAANIAHLEPTSLNLRATLWAQRRPCPPWTLCCVRAREAVTFWLPRPGDGFVAPSRCQCGHGSSATTGHLIARKSNDNPRTYRVIFYDGVLRVEIGSIAESARHTRGNKRYWHWGVDTMPLLSHGGRPLIALKPRTSLRSPGLRSLFHPLV